MSDDEHPLGDDISEALAQAWLDYKQKIIDIYKDIDNDKLLQFSGEVSKEEISAAFASRKLMERMVAYTEVAFRISMAKAEAVMEATGCKVYCVYHDCDMNLCGDKHDF